jgi:iron complex transport system substrate-binding protein
VTALNLVGYTLALLLAGLAVVAVGRPAESGATPTAGSAAMATVVDARGTAVPIRDWQRIVSLDLVSDELLGHLVAPRRIAAISSWVQGPEAWRHEGLPRLPGLTDLEAIIGARPDLVLVSTFSGADRDRIQRLRDSGIAVFDLGQAGGLRELTANLRRIAILTGNPARGERIAAQLERRMAVIAKHLSTQLPRRRALVVTPAGEEVYGGTVGTSYHDIVIAAGLIDAAEGRFAEAWPKIGAEQAIVIDPDLIITREGGGAELRRKPGFSRLRAVCAGAIIELPVELFDSPGVSMLDAAELLHERAYP